MSGSRGTTCPRCRQYAPVLKSGAMGRHRTDCYAIGQRRGGQVKEMCPYSGVTPAEANEGITALRKTVAAYGATQRGCDTLDCKPSPL